jgi:hypothetical protein
MERIMDAPLLPAEVWPRCLASLPPGGNPYSHLRAGTKKTAGTSPAVPLVLP